MSFFTGYYIKCTNQQETVAFIFGKAFSKKEKTAFIQVITKDNSYQIKFDSADFYIAKHGFEIKIGPNIVNEKGMFLDITNGNLKIKGEIKFGPFEKLKYNAMGPLKFLPFMECNHIVVSMQHKLSGQIIINEQSYSFDDGDGYIEGDRGRSFPQKYFWTHCFISNNKPISIFASCAKIPYLGLKFTGTICVIHIEGKEFRLATYLGARVKSFGQNKLIIQQGFRKNKTSLEIEVLDTKNAQPLLAPMNGKMNRIIEESIKKTLRYKFSKGSENLIDVVSNNACHEFSDF